MSERPLTLSDYTAEEETIQAITSGDISGESRDGKNDVAVVGAKGSGARTTIAGWLGVQEVFGVVQIDDSVLQTLVTPANTGSKITAKCIVCVCDASDTRVLRKLLDVGIASSSTGLGAETSLSNNINNPPNTSIKHPVSFKNIIAVLVDAPPQVTAWAVLAAPFDLKFVHVSAPISHNDVLSISALVRSIVESQSSQYSSPTVSQRTKRLSILRPRSSMRNLRASLPPPAQLKKKKYTKSSLSLFLNPSAISTQTQLDLLYSRFNPKTRGWLFSQISDWISKSGKENSRILWVTGIEGSGKSTACAALIQDLPKQVNNILTTWVFLRQDVRANAKDAINNLIYRLAQVWPDFSAVLTTCIEALDSTSSSCLSIPRQLRLLFTAPLLKLLSIIPYPPKIVCFVDGVNDIYPAEARREFIFSLKTELNVLPASVKFVFTSPYSEEMKGEIAHFDSVENIELAGPFHRRDLNKVHRSDIMSMLVPTVISNSSLTDEVLKVLRDDTLEDGEVNDELHDAAMTLTAKSDGIFLYSRFAFEAMKMEGLRYRNVSVGSRTIEAMPNSSFPDILMGFTSYLYRADCLTDYDTSVFRSIMGALPHFQKPISINGLASFLEIPSPIVRLTILRTSRLFDNTQADTVQIAHSCISRFFTSDACCDTRFRINRHEAELDFLLRCLKFVLTELRANPLNLEDPSAWINCEIPDLDACVRDKIPEHSRYSAEYFGWHLEASLSKGGVFSKDVQNGGGASLVDWRVMHAVQDLIGVFAAEKVLAWIEALSLMGVSDLEVAVATTLKRVRAFLVALKPSSSRISKLVGFLKRSSSRLIGSSSTTRTSPTPSFNSDDFKIVLPAFIESQLPSPSAPTLNLATTMNLLTDALKLMANFSIPITSAAFHIYTTAVPFSPAASQIQMQYQKSAQRAAFAAQGTSRRIPIVVRGVGSVWSSNLITWKCGNAGVKAVCGSACGRWIVCGGLDGIVRVFDVQNGHLYRTFEAHSGEVWNVSISSDSTRVVSGAADQLVKTWLISTGECIKSIGAKTFSVNSLALTKDTPAKIVTIVDLQTTSAVSVRDSLTNEAIWNFTGHQASKRVMCVSVSADASLTVSGGEDSTIRLWDMKTGLGIKTLEGHMGAIGCVCVSADSRWIVSGGLDDWTVRVWDVATGRCWQILEGHEDSVECVAILPDGKRIVSGSRDGTLRIWEMNTSDTPSTSGLSDDSLGHNNVTIRAIKISSNGLAVATAGIDGLIKIWSTESGRLLRNVELHSIRGAETFQDGVDRVAAAQVLSEDQYEYFKFNSSASGSDFESLNEISGAFGVEADMILVPGGARVSIDRIEIRKRRSGESGGLAMVKIDGKMMMLTKVQLDAIEAQIEAVRRGATSPQYYNSDDEEDGDGGKVDEYANSSFTIEESWHIDEDGWVWDKRGDGVRRFWLASDQRGDIASYHDRIVAIATVSGQVLIVHV
ncbi:Dip2/Utp12 protein [Physocladia obscura]|uniref:Dip2/Utp12 protein n=1 Tax=Physocladia obscura TaxID=109957 RepID=A0AAD5TF88_9FUNG|nr:Dip2/Utp12 protein [Physocladia obscura]